MLRCDALIVGGGPGGSTCARTLRQAGWNVIVADRARFPRDKVCAGWLTPEVFPVLELDPAEYRATGLTLQEITGFRTGLTRGRQIETRYPAIVSYAIRRCEFDDFLLRRSHAQVHDATPITTLRRRGDVWIADDLFETPVIVGAGGHFCPVARYLRGRAQDPAPVVAQEAEFRLDNGSTSVEPQTPELFFCRDFDGYAWCVRKGDYLNVGIGRRTSAGFTKHRRDFESFLESSGRVSGASFLRWRGHAYLAAGAGARPLVDHGMMSIGDAAGLAYPESGEGIRPAIEGGRLASETLIAADGRYSVDRLQPYETEMHRLHPRVRPAPQPVRPFIAAGGRALMHSHRFVRHVLLDRWFLRRETSPGAWKLLGSKRGDTDAATVAES